MIRFVDIASGTDHLLALTSAGRTFAHPISLLANSHGQLGLRKFDVPAPSSSHPYFLHPHERVEVELTPKSIADPYARASPTTRQKPVPGDAPLPTEQDRTGEQEHPQASDKHIRFCDTLFEVPALRDVQIGRIAAGARSSYVLTTSGRVLGWGANEFGYVHNYDTLLQKYHD